MLAKRIIPCLDIKDGRVVKGVNFIDLKDAGDPVELSLFYSQSGADELAFLDITATLEKRKTLVSLVEKIAKKIDIPFTVGGGISSIKDIRSVLLAGADKVSLNTAVVKNPSLVTKAAKIFGSQCIVVAIDAKKIDNRWKVSINGGRKITDLNVLSWVKNVTNLGAGEILLTSMDTDGTKKGFDVELTRKVSESVSIPVIASGGAGSVDDFADVLMSGKADAALAASLFHFGELEIQNVKKYLFEKGVSMRL